MIARFITSFMVIAWTLSMTFNSAFAFSTTPINVTVAPNGKVNLRNYYMYTLGPCRAYPAPQITSSGVKLGRLIVTKSMRRMNPNPCDANFEYELASVVYEAGSATGREEFTLFIHDGAQFHHVKTTIQITGASAQEKVPGLKTDRSTKAIQPKQNELSAEKILILKITSIEPKCRPYNETFQLGVAGTTIKEEKVKIATQEWLTTGILSTERFQIRFRNKSDEITILGNRSKSTGNGKWVSSECSGSATINVVE